MVMSHQLNYTYGNQINIPLTKVAVSCGAFYLIKFLWLEISIKLVHLVLIELRITEVMGNPLQSCGLELPGDVGCG